MGRGCTLAAMAAVAVWIGEPGLAEGQAPAPKPRPAAAPSPALAQIKDLNSQARKAFEAYSYRAARKALEQALQLAVDNHVGQDPALAETYLLLGITSVAGFNDLYRGLHYFVCALRLDARSAIPKAVATPQLTQMLDKARQAEKTVGRPPTIAVGTATEEQATERKTAGPKSLGLDHTPVDSARRGFPIPVRVQAGIDVQAHRMNLHYRPAGQVAFQVLQMQKTKDVFRIAIPAEATSGRYIHYYIEALDQRGRLAARNGSAASPNVTIIR